MICVNWISFITNDALRNHQHLTNLKHLANIFGFLSFNLKRRWFRFQFSTYTDWWWPKDNRNWSSSTYLNLIENNFQMNCFDNECEGERLTCRRDVASMVVLDRSTTRTRQTCICCGSQNGGTTKKISKILFWLFKIIIKKCFKVQI